MIESRILVRLTMSNDSAEVIEEVAGGTIVRGLEVQSDCCSSQWKRNSGRDVEKCGSE
jgi:hypothetical protein